MRDVLIAVVLVVAEFAAVHAVRADVLCIRRSGAVVVRTPACRRKEVRMDVAALGLQGPPGSKGDPGVQGLPGPVQTLDVQTVVNQQSAGAGLQRTEATCPAGYSLTGGGAGTGSGGSSLIGLGPGCLAGDPNCWTLIYYNPPGGAINGAYALCARLQ